MGGVRGLQGLGDRDSAGSGAPTPRRVPPEGPLPTPRPQLHPVVAMRRPRRSPDNGTWTL